MAQDLRPEDISAAGGEPGAVYQHKLTDRPEEILQFILDARAEGLGTALVTLVDIIDGAARSPGAQMAVRADGGYCGYVSGGCVEAAAAAEAVAAISAGRDRFVRFGKGSPFFDIVLPCGGGLGLSIHVVGDDAPIAEVLGALAKRRAAALIYDQKAETLVSAEPGYPSGWSGDCFRVNYRPPLRIVVYGSGIEGQTFVRVAEAAGLDVRLDDNGSTVGDADMHTALVMLRHDLDSEIAVLQRALTSDAFYIGCLGSRRTHARRTEMLSAQGVEMAQIARIRGPVGLFGPARDAASISVSVLAEIFKLREEAASGRIG